MAISRSKYVAITSGVGGAAAVNNRELIARLFTDNAKTPANTALEFSTLADVAEFYGTESKEYQSASVYFGFVNKSQRAPGKISFFAYNANGSAPFIFGTVAPASLAQFKAVTNGGFTLNMGGVSYEVTGLDFSAVTDYAGVASAIQEKVQANVAGGELWTDATVSFVAEDTAFVLKSGTVGQSTILAATAPAAGTDISGLLGWNTASAPVISQGASASTLTEILTNSADISNNYGSFSFILTDELTAEQIVEVAKWTQAQNLDYMYCQRVTPEDYATVQPQVATYTGVSLEYDAVTDNSFSFVLPMAILASTDFERVNGTVSYMYTQAAGVNVAVTTNTLSNTLDSMRINYYGATQQAGQLVAFYQPGMLQGEVADQGVFANEMWLKDAMTVQFLNQLIATPKWAANKAGIAVGTALAQDVIERAKRNGAISSGKELTAVQKAYITTITGNENAWREVYLNGCYFSGSIVTQVQNGQQIFVFKYLLVYSKGDAVRKVDGTHTLI